MRAENELRRSRSGSTVLDRASDDIEWNDPVAGFSAGW